MAISKARRYDALISIGMNCTMATQLRARGLRHASYPFDWLNVFSLDALTTIVSLIQTRFQNFLQYENLEVNSDETIMRRTRVLDRVLQVEFIHDFFSKTIDKQELSKVQEKYKRRIDRFYKTISTFDSICLLLAIDKPMLSQMSLVEAYEKIREVFPTGVIDIFAVVFDDEINNFETIECNGGSLYINHVTRTRNYYDTSEKVWEFAWLDEVGLTNKFEIDRQSNDFVARKMTYWERLHYRLYRHNYKWLERRGLIYSQFDA